VIPGLLMLTETCPWSAFFKSSVKEPLLLLVAGENANFSDIRLKKRFKTALPISVPDDTISYVPFGASTAHLIFILHIAVFLKITVHGNALWFYLSGSFFP
jgi:hypothetical protein